MMALRGYAPVYREHETNHCPGCGRTHWLIGRFSAQCAFCETAMPLEASFSKNSDDPTIVKRGHGGGKVR